VLSLIGSDLTWFNFYFGEIHLPSSALSGVQSPNGTCFYLLDFSTNAGLAFSSVLVKESVKIFAN
jgi:hypothetical protein